MLMTFYYCGCSKPPDHSSLIYFGCIDGAIHLFNDYHIPWDAVLYTFLALCQTSLTTCDLARHEYNCTYLAFESVALPSGLCYFGILMSPLLSENSSLSSQHLPPAALAYRGQSHTEFLNNAGDASSAHCLLFWTRILYPKDRVG